MFNSWTDQIPPLIRNDNDKWDRTLFFFLLLVLPDSRTVFLHWVDDLAFLVLAPNFEDGKF